MGILLFSRASRNLTVPMRRSFFGDDIEPARVSNYASVEPPMSVTRAKEAREYFISFAFLRATRAAAARGLLSQHCVQA